jgi:transcriptional regulator with XRE-family HTH domain
MNRAKSARPETESNELLLLVVGEVLAKRRLLANMSQRELAEQAHVNRTYVSDIERGLGNVTIVLLDRICNALDCSPKVLVEEVYTLYNTQLRRLTRKNKLNGRSK